jgi:hypothetical protein
VACADGRLRSFSLATPPVLVREQRVEGDIRSLFVLGQQAWVEIARYEARPVRQVSGAEPPVTPAAPPAPPTPEAIEPKPVEPAPAPAKEENIVFPSREGGIVIVGAGLRAMVPIGTLGVGGLFDVNASWHATIPLALRARVRPAGGVTTSGGTNPYASGGGVAAGSLDALFDARFFAVGLGFGFGTFANQNPYGFATTDVSAHFVVSQHLRIGTLDGLSLTGQTLLIALPRGFEFYGGEGMLQVPLRRGWQLQLRGGGSLAPHGYGELGMRIGIGGDDHEKPRFFITPSVGAALIRSYAGPSVGLAVDYRF